MGSSALFQSRQPRYHALAESLSRAIRDGTYPVGTLLPPETELGETFGVSRQTVREAIRLLQQAGLVTRHQGVGTRVSRAEVETRYVQTLHGVADLWQYVKDTRRRTLALRDVRPGEGMVALPGDGSAVWRMLEGLRILEASGEPVSWTQVCVPARYGAVMERADASAVPVYSLIESEFGLRARSIEQEISAVAIPAAISRLLQAKAGSPGLAIVRRYASDADEVFEVTLSIHPASRYTYSMKVDLAYGAA